MAVNNQYFSSKTFKFQIYFLVCLFAIDIIMNSFIQFLGFGSKTAISQYNLVTFSVPPKSLDSLLFVVQLVIQFTMLFTTMSLFFRTFHFQLGAVKMICKEFKWTFLFIALYPIFFIFERVYKLVYLAKVEYISRNVISIWDNGFYMTVYVLKYVTGFAYYIFVLDAAYELGKSKYYKPDTNIIKR
jgi:hypothetical protein